MGHILGMNIIHKLYIGSGHKKLNGYISIDVNHDDRPHVVADIVKLPFPNDSIVEIFGEAVFEHIWAQEVPQALAEWHRVLADKGILRLYWIPDFEVVCHAYLTHQKSGTIPRMNIETASGYTHGGYLIRWKHRGIHQVHKDIYDKAKLNNVLTSNGFKIIHMTNICFPGETLPVNINVQAIKS